MEAQLRPPLKPFNTIEYCVGPRDFRGCPQLGPHDAVSRTTEAIFSSLRYIDDPAIF